MKNVFCVYRNMKPIEISSLGFLAMVQIALNTLVFNKFFCKGITTVHCTWSNNIIKTVDQVILTFNMSRIWTAFWLIFYFVLVCKL